MIEKRKIITSIAFSLCTLGCIASPLTIYKHINQSGTSAGCEKNIVYSGNSVPGGLNNQISSILLEKGYGVVLGINNSCVGASKFYRAHTQNRLINVPTATFNDKISFIRVVQLDTTVKKKGFGGADPDIGVATGCSWWYNWGSAAWSQQGMEYVPMRWNGGTASGISSYGDSLKTRKFTSHLAFNEPDNSSQANMSVTKALDRYESLLKSGLRMGSPVCTQDAWQSWLSDFMDGASDRGYRVDFIALHWYDWGNQTSNSTGTQIKNRMVAKISNARNGLNTNMGVWLTEFNANVNRTNQNIHKDFINAAIPYINGQNWFERYAYFREGGGWHGSSTNLTTSGVAYRDAPNKWSDWRESNNMGW